MIFIDKDGTRYRGQLKPETMCEGYVLDVLVITRENGDGQPRRIGRYEASPFLLLEATLDERARLDRAEYHLRSAPAK